MEKLLKKDLRKKYNQIRDSISDFDLDLKSKVIEEKILNLDIDKYENFLIYINIKSEVKTNSLIQKLILLNKNVFIPKIIDDEMYFVKIHSLDDLKLGKYNIPEPNKGQMYKGEKAFVIVPGLVFSKEKYRIGYGKGYYDKFISKNPQNFYLGICFENQIIDKFDFDKFDEKIDVIITEENIIN